MKISELIAKLEEAKAEHGDIDVTAATGYDNCELPIDEVAFHDSVTDCEDYKIPHIALH